MEICGYSLTPEMQKRIVGSVSLVVGIALIVFASCFVSGAFTPAIKYHIAAYSAGGMALLSVIPFVIASSIFCRKN